MESMCRREREHMNGARAAVAMQLGPQLGPEVYEHHGMRDVQPLHAQQDVRYSGLMRIRSPVCTRNRQSPVIISAKRLSSVLVRRLPSLDFFVTSG